MGYWTRCAKQHARYLRAGRTFSARNSRVKCAVPRCACMAAALVYRTELMKVAKRKLNPAVHPSMHTFVNCRPWHASKYAQRLPHNHERRTRTYT
eukprot:IDg11678t1